METRKKDRMKCSTLQKNFNATSQPLQKKQFSKLLVRDISAFIVKNFQVVYRRQEVPNYLYFTTSQA